MRSYINFFLVIIISGIYLGVVLYNRNSSDKGIYIVSGSGNPGVITLYRKTLNFLEKVSSIKTNYKFVHTVRLGDIYNNGEISIIAGVSNSFFDEPYGCKVISYDLDFNVEKLIDDVGDLRCKDLTIGDLDNDGLNEIVLATHGKGHINLYKWKGKTWEKEKIDENFIATIDIAESTNHKVSNDILPCESCVIQTAVHIVKIVDIDNDGLNELIATVSSPLELKEQDEISFVLLYKKAKDKWTREIIDRDVNIEFRSIQIGDIYNKGKNVLVVGTGSPRNSTGTIVSYEYYDKQWQKRNIYRDEIEKNMKGLILSDIEDTGQESIIVATGFPHSKILKFTWNGEAFIKNEITRVSSILKDGGSYNSMATLVTSNTIITGGMTTFPDKEIGWEGTTKGFVIYHSLKDNKWSSQIIDSTNILGMDLFQ